MQKQSYCSYVSSQKKTVFQHWRYHPQTRLVQEKMTKQIKKNLSHNTEEAAD